MCSDAAGAAVSPDGKHRYHLWRLLTCEAVSAPRSLCWVMLNPSTADALVDDPTIRKCMGFARRWHFNRIDVVNLFSFRATSPKVLKAEGFPNGPDADWQLQAVFGLTFVREVVVAWGTQARHRRQRVAQVVRFLEDANLQPLALRLNTDGSPQHPLYVPYDTPPRAWP